MSATTNPQTPVAAATKPAPNGVPAPAAKVVANSSNNANAASPLAASFKEPSKAYLESLNLTNPKTPVKSSAYPASPSSHSSGQNSPRDDRPFKVPVERVVNKKVVVAVRVRPMTQQEQEQSERAVRIAGRQIFVKEPVTKVERAFNSDWAYDYRPGVDDRLNARVGGLCLDTVRQGHSCALLSYGAPGTGKSTYLFGDPTNIRGGLIYEFCRELLLKKSCQQSEDVHFDITFSMVEIFLERVRDLLNPPEEDEDYSLKYQVARHSGRAHLISMSHQGLRVREHPKNGPYIEGLTVVPINYEVEVEKLLREGLHNLDMDERHIHKEHIRGHVVVQIGLTVRQTRRRGVHEEEETQWCKMSFCDLAGFSVPTHTEKSFRQRDIAHKNKALLALAESLRLSSQTKNPSLGKAAVKAHHPYRRSQLTLLLRDCFNGYGKSILVTNLSPTATDFDRTVSSLQLANSVMSEFQCKLKTRHVTVCKKDLTTMIDELHLLLEAERQKISDLEFEIEHLKKEHTDRMRQLSEALLDEKSRSRNIVELEQRNAALLEKLNKLKQELKAATLEYERVAGSRDQIAQRLALQREIEELKKRIDDHHTNEAVQRFKRLRPVLGALLGESCNIKEVHPDSPAAAAGLLVNDEIVSVDGVPMTFKESFGPVIRSSPPGKVLHMVVLRGGKEIPLDVQLGAEGVTFVEFKQLLANCSADVLSILEKEYGKLTGAPRKH
eukprot:gnl/Spiro4/9432_TR4989_c0_g1_i1.p1 gnl/Spiro4/9432_TR4989_c0_g1~~gnl/Spiro4/9432_TR4989_c0_g1_i1.p1  ORF type:complete len:723 (+),score=230.98 gnl/Spiro4/9432_TR4989_c0_g1_i1:78-2246(+)